jgi:hypothetical protein
VDYLIVTQTNEFTFEAEAQPLIEGLKEHDLIFYCDGCRVWHPTERGYRIGLEQMLILHCTTGHTSVASMLANGGPA